MLVALIEIFVVSLALACSGCISIKTHEDGVRDAYIHGLQNARTIAHYQGCGDAVKIISGAIEARGGE